MQTHHHREEAARDVVGLTPCTAATTLSAFGDPDLGVGQSAGGATYPIGVRQHQGDQATCAADSALGGPAFVDRVARLGLVARRVVSCARLAGPNGLPALVAVVERDRAPAPPLAEVPRRPKMMADAIPAGTLEER